MPASIADSVIGGSLCDARSAYWVDQDGHPVLHVTVPAVSDVSAEYLGDGGNSVGSDETATVTQGMKSIVVHAPDVSVRTLRAVSIAVAGQATGTCVAPKA